MNFTKNNNLKKPAATEGYNIQDFNDNSDTIDELLGKITNLSTKNKSDLVAAINELREQNENLDDNKTDRIEVDNYRSPTDVPSSYKYGLTVFYGDSDEWIAQHYSGYRILVRTYALGGYYIYQEITSYNNPTKRYRIGIGLDVWGKWQDVAMGEQIENLENNKAFRKKIQGAQTHSYRRSVIALCSLNNTQPSLESVSIGSISFNRVNSLEPPILLNFAMSKRYNSTIPYYSSLVLGFGGEGGTMSTFRTIRSCTFTYKGQKYGGIEFFIAEAEYRNIEFIGRTTFDIFGLDYWDTLDNVALNTEVANSINFDEPVYANNLFFNREKVVTDKSTNWINATLQNGFTGLVKYRKNIIGQVELAAHGQAIIYTKVPTGTVILTIPKGYRPVTNIVIMANNYDGGLGKMIPLGLSVDGELRIMDNTNLIEAINRIRFNYVYSISS